jgi:multiple sugar transport system ATP-binding protein
LAGVTLHKVSKRYGEVSVIEDLDLEIFDGELMVLVGPSGCGKSTVLRMIAGLEDISGGSIAIGGRAVDRLAPKDRDIAMVFQNYALYPHMTIRENLEFGLRMRKTPRAEMDRLVEEAAGILGMTDVLSRKPGQLSGGQRQRVALGRALVRHPAVFLFDEPLSNLDAKLRVQMRAEIKKLQQRLGTTSVYVTHDQIEAMTMGARIAVMRAGRIQQVGAPLEIYQRPVNLFVANFIGTPPMNFLRARLEGDGIASLATGARLSLPPENRPREAADGRQVVLGIRPENVVDDGEAKEGPTISLPVEVDFVEPLGDEVIVHGRLGEEALLCKLAPTRVPAAGSRLVVAIELSRMHVFDAETELRMTA